MQRRIKGWLALMAMIGLGCSGAPPLEGQSDGKNPSSATDLVQLERQNLVTIENDHLVQILIYGLSAFEFHRDAQGDPVQITAHFPAIATPQHEITLAQGKYINTTTSEWVGFHQKEPLEVPGKQISFDLSGSLEEWKPNTNHGGTDGFPIDPEDAGDVRWMIGSRNLDPGVCFDAAKASTSVIFDSGRLETCALVHDPDPGDRVCRIEVPGILSKTSASEYMVVRQVVPDTTISLPILLDGGSETMFAQVIELLDCSAAKPQHCVEWKDKHYSKVFDVAVRNVPAAQGGDRDMKSDHANMLKSAGMFPKHDSARNWNLRTPDCKFDQVHQAWVCDDCKADLQPTCWGYFLRYRGSFSGFDQSVCPFVGYP